MLEIIKSRRFLLFWLSQIFTQLGDGLIRTVVIYLVASATDHAFMIGFVIFAQMLPVALLGIFSGPLADRFSRKWLMVGSNLLQLAVVILMMLNTSNAPILLLLMSLYGLGIAVYEPAKASSIPYIVDQKLIPQAVSLSQGSGQAMMIIGPSVAGLLFLTDQNAIIFTIICTTYILSTLLIYMVGNLSQLDTTEPSDERETYFTSIKSGVRNVLGMPALRFLMLLLIPVTIAAGILNTNINALFLQNFQVPAEQYGFLLAVFGFGAVVGALIAPTLLKKIRSGALLVGSIGILGIFMALILVVQILNQHFGLSVVFIWAAVVGLINASLNVPISALFLQTTPSHFLARGSALMQVQVNVGSMTGILLGGWLAGIFTSLYTTAAVGICLLLTMTILPFLKGYRYLNSNRVTDEAELDHMPLKGGVIGGQVFKHELTDPDLLNVVIGKKLNEIISFLSPSPKTVAQIAQHFNETYEAISKELKMLEELGVVQRVSQDKSEEGEMLYSCQVDRDIVINLNERLLKNESEKVEQGIQSIIEQGIRILKKELERSASSKKYHVMISVTSEYMKAKDWRTKHLNMMEQHKTEQDAVEQAASEDPFNDLTKEEREKEGTYVFLLMSYRMDDDHQ